MSYNKDEFNFIKTRNRNVVAFDLSSTGVAGWDFVFNMAPTSYYTINIPSAAKYFLLSHTHPGGVYLSQESELTANPAPSPASGKNVTMPATSPLDLMFISEKQLYTLPVNGTKLYIRNQNSDGAKISINFRKGPEM